MMRVATHYISYWTNFMVKGVVKACYEIQYNPTFDHLNSYQFTEIRFTLHQSAYLR